MLCVRGMGRWRHVLRNTFWYPTLQADRVTSLVMYLRGLWGTLQNPWFPFGKLCSKVFPEQTGCWVASSKWILIAIDFNVKSNNRDRTSIHTVSVLPTGQ